MPATYLTAIGDLTARRLFIVHGWGGTPGENWFPWLRDMAERREFDVHAPAMPDASNPREAPWVGELAAEVGDHPDVDSYFVGHSLGCMAILRYLEGLGEGGIEWMQVAAMELGMTGGIWGYVRNVDFGTIGVGIVAIFVGTWAVSALIYRRRNSRNGSLERRPRRYK